MIYIRLLAKKNRIRQRKDRIGQDLGAKSLEFRIVNLLLTKY